MIPLDNRTRWNSWYSLLDGALKLESFVLSYISTYASTLDKDTLSPKEWAFLRTIHQFLGAFKSATKRLEGDNTHIGDVVIIMDALLTHTSNQIVRLLYLSHYYFY